MPDAPPVLVTLFETGIQLAHRTTSGRVLFGRLAGVVHPDLLPDRLRAPVRKELEQAYEATATRIDPKTVEKALKAAWGKAPDRVLDDGLDEEPLSVSPSAQVHAAGFEDERVAVKVSRPGIAQGIRSELALLDVLAGPLGTAFPALDVGAALRELRESALDELDLEHEGDQQQRVRRALRRNDDVVVPDVVGDLCADDVLVSRFVEGETLAEAPAPDPSATARRLVDAHVAAWREAGLVLTDTRPSHVVHLPDGRTGLLGVGVARPAPRERAAASVDAFVALGEADADAFVRAVVDGLGVLDAETAREAHTVVREVLGEFVEGPAKLDGPAVAKVTARAFGRIGDLMRIAGKATPQPADLAAGRMLGQLVATLSRLEATEDWAALAREASAA